MDTVPVSSIFDKETPRRRWQLSEKARWMLKGAGVALVAMLVVAVLLGGWVVYLRSLHGQMAYEYIQQVIAAQQQQQQAKPAPQATPESPK